MYPRLLIQQGPDLLVTFTHKVRSGKESNTMEWKKKVANLCVFICYVRFDRFSCFVLFCFVLFQFTNICPLMLRRLSVRDDWGSETCHTIKFIDGLEKRTTSVFVHVAITSWRVSNTLIKCLEKTTKVIFVTSSQWTPSDKEGVHCMMKKKIFKLTISFVLLCYHKGCKVQWSSKRFKVL